MRVKKRKDADKIIDARPDLVFTEKMDWQEVFGNENPIHVEVGCGKGDFIVGMAEKHADINYIAIDLQETVISFALDKVVASGLSNVKLIYGNGRDLNEYFAEHEIGLVYLNFSDPWPKARHEKRRLTYKDFLKTYQMTVVPNGQVHFKTDNRVLFEYSLASMSQYGMVLQQVWLDLHKDEEFDGKNVLTEYERKWSAKGYPIYRLEAKFVEESE
ncbi:tRNA (guanosine(46)-N7)-methyltransferase TrmB [Lactovum miscens]|uniref:tRNA (guanine-N(7)-)-methyltransferase n=1 Tax=Lactovum miscens TaxID=190387 RepID=A0A841C685_9LACT|nr:tRNA (guanosine(46)-N7)-methyltransferase TrmB [Lactovum miscens]MBB5888313.1 tRNA (guanine-N7-)-methyltransferase [Lactovum miscens]